MMCYIRYRLVCAKSICCRFLRQQLLQPYTLRNIVVEYWTAAAPNTPVFHMLSFFLVSATLFGAFNYKTSVVSDLVCLFSAFSFLVFVKFRLGFSVIPVSLLCFVVWQVIVECRCAFLVGQLLVFFFAN